MLEQILQHLNNWFLVPDGVHEDTYTIEEGSLVLPFLMDGQYFRICGSVFNDGLHQYPAANLVDETFDGIIWALAVPKSVVSLSEEMAKWEETNGAAASGPYQSESFGGYSYSKASSKSGGTMTVWDAFANRLSAYQKPRELGFVKPTRRNPPPFHPPYNPDYPWR